MKKANIDHYIFSLQAIFTSSFNLQILHILANSYMCSKLSKSHVKHGFQVLTHIPDVVVPVQRNGLINISFLENIILGMQPKSAFLLFLLAMLYF